MSDLPTGPRTGRRNPSLVGPIILVTIGVLALLANAGMLLVNFWQAVLRLWPLLLVLLGIEIIIGGLRLPWAANLLLSLVVVLAAVGIVVYVAQSEPGQGIGAESGPVQTQHLEQPLQSASNADVTVQFAMGDLTVKALADGSQLISADIRRSPNRSTVSLDVTPSGGTVAARLRAQSDSGPFYPFSGVSTYRWNVAVSPALPLSLRVNSTFSTNNLDLQRLKISDVRLEGAFSTSEVTLAASGVYGVRVASAFGTLSVIVPQGIAVRVRSRGFLSSVSVDQSRFPRSGDYYISRDYETAANKVDVRVDGAFSTVNVR